jgi:hypothetical protein
MNLMLHGIESMVESGDTLAPDGERIGKADIIMTNPPFGTKKGGGRPTRSDFSVTAETSNVTVQVPWSILLDKPDEIGYRMVDENAARRPAVERFGT